MSEMQTGGGRIDRMLKRLVDIGLSGAALIGLSPLLVAIAIAVRITTKGPALYRSQRIGRRGEIFEMLKFRSMRVGAPDVRNSDGSTYSHPDDPRTTWIGRWLRRTSLDELPQLWNVLRGDMSLVGPRPELPDQIRYYAPEDRLRLLVRPGITGLAQVSGRNELTWEQRRALDRQYVASMNFWKDLIILARTLPGVLSTRGVFGSVQRKVHNSGRQS